jgi:hypothetical protein
MDDFGAMECPTRLDDFLLVEAIEQALWAPHSET